MLNSEFILLIVVVFAVTFFWRYLLSSWQKSTRTEFYDIAVHAYLVGRISQNKWKKMITREDRLIVESRVIRPQLLYQLIALSLGKKRFLKYHYLINPSLDGLMNTCLFVLSCYYLARLGIEKNLLIYSICISIGYIFSPILFFFIDRMTHFGTRHFSFMVVMAAIICTQLFMLTNQWVFFLLAVLFNLLCVFTSQFAFQSILLIHLFYFFVSAELTPIFISLAGIFGSFLLAPRWFLQFISMKLEHFKWYHQALKKNIMNLDSYYRDFHIYVFFYGFSFVLAGLMKVFHTPVNTTGLVTGMEFYVYASLLLTAIIFLHPFRILGEAIRYMEYGVYFTNFLVVYSCLKYGHISILIFYFLIMISASLHAIYRLIEKSAAILTVTNTSVEELQEVLKAHPEKVILPIPFKMAFMLLPGCENRFVSSFLPMGKIEEISKTYSFPISNFRKIHKAYHFDWILTVKGMGARYDFTGLPRVFENKRYVIYRYD